MNHARPALGAEFGGTGLLLVLVVGSGIAVERLGTDPAVSLFIHAATVGIGLVLVGLILLLIHFRHEARIPGAVGAWVAAAIVATAYTGFANPAVTVARTVTDTFTGIHPFSAPMFLVAQLAGAFVAVGFVRSTVDPKGVCV